MRALLLLLLPSVAAADCVSEGVALARSDLDAALRALENAERRRDCRDDPLLHYNLGFVRHEVARRDRDPRLACDAADAYRRFLRLDQSGDADEMTRDRLAEVDELCRPRLDPRPEPVPVETQAETAPEPSHHWRWTALGVTGAAVATAAVTGALAVSEASDARETTSVAAWEEHADAADTLSGVSDVAWVVAGVGAVVTVLVWNSGDEPSVSVSTDGRAAWVGGRF